MAWELSTHLSQLNIISIAKLSEFFKRKSSFETSLFYLSVPTLTQRLLAQQPFHLGKCSGLSNLPFSSALVATRLSPWPSWCYLFWIWTANASSFNTLGPRRNGRHFADDIFKGIFLNENVWIPIKISLKFVPPINNIPALVQIMAWRRPGDKPLSGPIMVRLPTHICVTQPQWVNLGLWFATYFYMLKPPKKYGKHFANGNFKCFFLNEFYSNFIEVLKVPFDNETPLVQVKASCCQVTSTSHYLKWTSDDWVLWCLMAPMS